MEDRSRGPEPRRTGPAAAFVSSVLVIAVAGTLAAVSLARQSRVEKRLGEARAALDEARRALSSGKRERDDLRERVRELDGSLSASRETARVLRSRCSELEKERLEAARRLEERAADVLARRRRVVELQEEVVELVRERGAASDEAGERELDTMRRYEAELNRERARRRELEGELGVLDETRALRDRLKRLVAELERLVLEESEGSAARTERTKETRPASDARGGRPR